MYVQFDCYIPGGGGGTASLKVGTHCQITAPLSSPEFSLTTPYFLDLQTTAL